MNNMTPSLNAPRILVVGDVMLDQYWHGGTSRISPEAPVPVVRFSRDEFRLGGAANVANNVAALGGVARVIGLIGTDPAAEQLKTDAKAAGLDVSGLIPDKSRPTTRKVRVVTTRNQQVARVDYETDRDASAAVADALAERIRDAANASDAFVLSDYRKGVVTPAVIDAAVAAAHMAHIPLLVDPKVPQAERYNGASLITPNHHEAELMTHVRIRDLEDARRAAAVVHERTGASVLITWGEHGMFVSDRSDSVPAETLLPAAAREVADVTGAGDTVIAVLALGLASAGTLENAARLANIAAGLVVARFGPAAVTAGELLAALAPPA